jgi:hypothetical protein
MGVWGPKGLTGPGHTLICPIAISLRASDDRPYDSLRGAIEAVGNHNCGLTEVTYEPLRRMRRFVKCGTSR